MGSHFLQRARVALRSAEVLLESGDTLGAGNRIYYGVFDAVRAVLADAVGLDVVTIKTHSGIVRAFDAHVLRPSMLDRELARVIGWAMDLRLEADYGLGLSLSKTTVRTSLDQAHRFVGACAALIADRAPDR